MKHSPDPSSARVFFALWPTVAEQAQLAAWGASLKRLCGGRVMRSETLHATLVFIGNIESGRLEGLQQAAREVSGERFELCFDEARYWGHNHIVYAMPRHVPQQLVQLVDVLRQRLAARHFAFDRRAYQPHVTLLRDARWNDAALPAMQPVNWSVRGFALVQSVSRDGLAGYQLLARFPSGAGSG